VDHPEPEHQMDLDNFAKSEDTSSTHSMPAENGSKLNIKEERWGPLTFEDVHPKLPADKPVGYAHIVKLNRGDYVEIEDDECRLEDLRIGDGIVTFLYHWKPEELDKFLDHENYPKFEFWSRPKKSTGYHNFFIGRDGESVRVSKVQPWAAEKALHSIVWMVRSCDENLGWLCGLYLQWNISQVGASDGPCMDGWHVSTIHHFQGGYRKYGQGAGREHDLHENVG
jgi:hypothetical protein